MRSWPDRQRRSSAASQLTASWVALALLCSAGCASDAGSNDGEVEDAGRIDLEGPWSSFAERPCPPNNELSYESFGGPFLLDYCQGCHGSARTAAERQGAPLLATFDDLEDVRRLAELIWRMAGDQNRYMPPVGGPRDEVRKQLGEWLACGAPTRDDL